MSRERTRIYKQEIEKSLASPKLQDALHAFGDAYMVSRANAFANFDFEALRSEVAELKDRARERNPELIEEFTRKAEQRGATVFYAKTEKEANDYIANLAQERGVKKVVKSKSMASEETHLNKALEAAGVQPVETDLGEYIIQLAGQRPSHMVMPAIHMFKEEVAELFGKVTGKEEAAEIAHLVEVARAQLRQAYLDADMGISGANIAIAETGGLALVTNEGNARLASTVPKIHVALVGIDKLVHDLEDAAKILRVLPRNATGQPLTSYVTWIQGAVPCGDEDKELHIVLLDNGRTTLAADKICKEATRCVRCGACANVCPVYQTVGGHVFGHIYIGAIGIILTAFFHGLDNAAELVRACIGCRSCVSICPGKIDLENIILNLRETIGDEEGIGAGKSLVFRKVMRNRKLFHGLLRAASMLQKPVTKGERTIRHLPLFFSGLTEWRTLPAVAEKPLRDIFDDIPQQVAKPRYKVNFYGGCANDFLFPELGVDLVTVMNHLNVQVSYPKEQNCCGVPALYSGDKETAVELAKQNITAMLAGDPDFVLTTCPTCTMALQRDFVDHLRDDPAWAAKAERLAEITVDAAGFIVNQLGAADQFKGLAEQRKVTYHDSCHLKRGAGVWKEPRQLIETSGHELVEMDHADRCCGFGGSYSLTSHPNISKMILGDKLDDIKNSGADCVAMDCPGCMMQIRGGLEKNELDVQVRHTVELMAEALKKK